MALELQKGIVLSMHPVGAAWLDIHQRVHKDNNMYIIYYAINKYKIDVHELLI